jgi:hypothetical protein
LAKLLSDFAFVEGGEWMRSFSWVDDGGVEEKAEEGLC